MLVRVSLSPSTTSLFVSLASSLCLQLNASILEEALRLGAYGFESFFLLKFCRFLGLFLVELALGGDRGLVLC